MLAQLHRNPDVLRAFVTRFEEGLLIISLAVRGIGTCELSIPADRIDPSNLADYAALLNCFEPTR